MQTSLNKKHTQDSRAQVAGCRWPRDVRSLQEVYHFPCGKPMSLTLIHLCRCSLLSPKGSFPSFFWITRYYQ